MDLHKILNTVGSRDWRTDILNPEPSKSSRPPPSGYDGAITSRLNVQSHDGDDDESGITRFSGGSVVDYHHRPPMESTSHSSGQRNGNTYLHPTTATRYASSGNALDTNAQLTEMSQWKGKPTIANRNTGQESNTRRLWGEEQNLYPRATRRGAGASVYSLDHNAMRWHQNDGDVSRGIGTSTQPIGQDGVSGDGQQRSNPFGGNLITSTATSPSDDRRNVVAYENLRLPNPYNPLKRKRQGQEEDVDDVDDDHVHDNRNKADNRNRANRTHRPHLFRDYRRVLLESDHWATNVKAENVTCRGCGKIYKSPIRKGKRVPYDASAWIKHRSHYCTAISFKLEVVHKASGQLGKLITFLDRYWEPEYAAYLKNAHANRTTQLIPKKPGWLLFNRLAARLDIDIPITLSMRSRRRGEDGHPRHSHSREIAPLIPDARSQLDILAGGTYWREQAAE